MGDWLFGVVYDGRGILQGVLAASLLDDERGGEGVPFGRRLRKVSGGMRKIAERGIGGRQIDVLHRNSQIDEILRFGQQLDGQDAQLRQIIH